MLIKFLILMFFALISYHSEAKDLSNLFNSYYSNFGKLDKTELNYLQDKQIILIPGILAESIISSDHSSSVDFSCIFTDYFGLQLDHFKDLKLNVSRLPTSSKNVATTMANIQSSLRLAQAQNRKVIFMTHSLGGIALLDLLISDLELHKDQIEGIIFMQSPFYGSSIANVYLSMPKLVRAWLEPLFPFVNLSVETIKYLTVESRTQVMKESKDRINDIVAKIPILTVAGVANGTKSIFAPSMQIIHHGCVGIDARHCLTPILYRGPYDIGDGMVPFKSSLLPGVDTIILPGVDHGELILRMPFTEYERKKTTEVLVKMLLDKVEKMRSISQNF